MRGTWSGVIALLCCLAAAASAQAGLYNTAEPDESPASLLLTPKGVQPLPFERFRRDVLSDLIGIANPKPESPKRRRYLSRRDELLAKSRSGRLSAEEQMNLGAYLIRLKQYDDAVRLLTRAAEEDPSNALCLANLATAHQGNGQPERAIYWLQRLKRKGRWNGLTAQQRDWFQHAEEYHLRLLLLRTSEMPRGGSSQPATAVDALFSATGAPVRWVGENGHYEPGQMAASERAKLPADALALVEQLLIWLPDDTRLYWLFGELLNAQGDVQGAAAVFEDCVWNRGWNVETLKEHRRLVKEAKPAAEPVGQITVTSTPPRQSPPDWLPSRGKLLVVGSLAFAIIAGLVTLQIKEVRRRRLPPSSKH
jgi:tetratricopeptide (TPR) repeat protein